MEIVNMIKEWNLLRTIACVSIVLLHTTTWLIMYQTPVDNEILTFLRLVLCFATPTFILLSIIILANRYPDQLPKNFWWARLLYIYLPFVAFSAIDAINRMNQNKGFWEYFHNNIVRGQFTGWFILVIFQLYFLYWIVTKFKWTRWIIFPAGIVVSYVHFHELVFSEEFYKTYELELRISATIWLMYFVFAYFVGRHYQALAPWLLKARYILLVAVGMSVYYLYDRFETIGVIVESRTIYLVPTVITLTLAILAWGQLVPKFKVVDLISRYAFAIYLGHWQVMVYIAEPIVKTFDEMYIRIPLIFGLAIACSIFFAYVLQFIPGGTFVVGKIKKPSKSPIKKVDETMTELQEAETKSY